MRYLAQMTNRDVIIQMFFQPSLRVTSAVFLVAFDLLLFFVMIYVLLILLLSLVAIAALIVVCSLRSTRHRPKRASVIVLGDIGRSPRMCNHAVSLADEGWSVDLIGYAESTPSQRVLQHPRIRIRPISPGWRLPKRPKILYILLAPLAAMTRAFNLAAVIIGSGRKGIILVQVYKFIDFGTIVSGSFGA